MGVVGVAGRDVEAGRIDALRDLASQRVVPVLGHHARGIGGREHPAFRVVRRRRRQAEPALIHRDAARVALHVVDRASHRARRVGHVEAPIRIVVLVARREVEPRGIRALREHAVHRVVAPARFLQHGAATQRGDAARRRRSRALRRVPQLAHHVVVGVVDLLGEVIERVQRGDQASLRVVEVARGRVAVGSLRTELCQRAGRQICGGHPVGTPHRGHEAARVVVLALHHRADGVERGGHPAIRVVERARPAVARVLRRRNRAGSRLVTQRRDVDQGRIPARHHHARAPVVGVLHHLAQRAHFLHEPVDLVVHAPAALVLRCHSGTQCVDGHRQRIARPVHQHRGVDQRAVSQRRRDLPVPVETVLGQGAERIDIADPAARRVVDVPVPIPGRILAHQQLVARVVGVGRLAEVRRLRAAFEHRHESTGPVVAARRDQPVEGRDLDLAIGVVVDRRREALRGVGGRAHATEAVVRVARRAVARIDRREQLAVPVVDILRDRARVVRDADALGVDLAVLDGLVELSQPVVLEVLALRASQIAARGPRRHGGFSRNCVVGQACHRIRACGVLDRRIAFAEAVVAVLGHSPFRADLETQLRRVGLGVDEARGCGGRRAVSGNRLGDQLLRPAVGTDHDIACAVRLPRRVAPAVVLGSDPAPFPVGDARDVAVAVVLEARAGDGAVDRRRVHLQQLSLRVVGVDGVLQPRVGHRRAAVGRVVRKTRHRAQRVGERLHPVVAADELVGDAQARAIALRDAGHARARAVVGVGRLVDLAVGDRAVLRRQVDGDGGEAVAGVVAITDARLARAVLADGTDLRQQRAVVVVVGPLRSVAVADHGHQAVGPVRVLQRVPRGVVGGDEPTLRVVALAQPGAAFGPDQFAGPRDVFDDVVRARARRREVRASARVEAEHLHRAVPADALDRAARRVDRAGELDLPGVQAQRPVVAVVVVELALAVVRPQARGAQAVAGEQLVLVLQDQVAGRCVDVGQRPRPTQRRIPERSP